MKILHIAPQGYDEGIIEALVETLGIQAHVAYIGQENHTQAIWNGYTEGAAGLVYTYYPNSNQHGISIRDLGRANIPPGIDLKSQRIAVLCCMSAFCLKMRVNISKKIWHRQKGEKAIDIELLISAPT